MNQLVQAEWRKTTGNRVLVGCTIWLYPLLAFLLLGLFAVLLLFTPDFRDAFQENPPRWDEFGLFGWTAVFEELGVLRLPILGFMGVIFSLEYQHNTFKTVLPGNSRVRFMLAKYIALSGFIVVTLAMMSVIFMIGMGFLNAAVGEPYPPALTASNLGAFLVEYAALAVLAFTALSIFAGVASLLAVITRSVAFTVAGTLIISLLETLAVRIPVSLLVNEFNVDPMIYMYLVTPTYNINNLRSFIENGDPYRYALMPDGPQFSAAGSVAVLGFWLVLFIGLTLFIFRRQDIHS